MNETGSEPEIDIDTETTTGEPPQNTPEPTGDTAITEPTEGGSADVPEELTDYTFDGQPKVAVSDLDVHYGDDHALRGISMEIPERSVTALIGPSGCGKSTFLRCLNRMNDRIRTARIDGSVRVDGAEIYRNDVDLVELRKRVGMVFQQPNPFPKSVRANVAYGPRKHGEIETGVVSRLLGRDSTDEEIRLVERSLERAALYEEVEDRLDASAVSLSGGQQQRLCIARCLATDPEVILMDEPASALDPIATSKIEDLIEDLAKEYTVVIVTHNMQQAARISDQTAVFLTGGQLAEYADTDRLFENPESERVEEYISGKFG